MAREIERKYRVKDDSWRSNAKGIKFRQGYIETSGLTVVRVRTAGKKGYLTIKGKSEGISRDEFEYEIPALDAEEMISQLCVKSVIEKTRYLVDYRHHIFEIDVFEGRNKGLVIAEVELKSEEETVDLPDWIGDEVSDDPKYFNSNLVIHPFADWQRTE